MGENDALALAREFSAWALVHLEVFAGSPVTHVMVGGAISLRSLDRLIEVWRRRRIPWARNKGVTGDMMRRFYRAIYLFVFLTFSGGALAILSSVEAFAPYHTAENGLGVGVVQRRGPRWITGVGVCLPAVIVATVIGAVGLIEAEELENLRRRRLRVQVRALVPVVVLLSLRELVGWNAVGHHSRPNCVLSSLAIRLSKPFNVPCLSVLASGSSSISAS